MTRGLSDYARMYITDKAGFANRLGVPVLLWEATGELKASDEQWNQTASGVGPRVMRPRPGEPLVFELRKFAEKKNPFVMGITLGRVENNDVVIDDTSISRFHAWFQQDPKLGWVVVDAESKNGCVMNGARLEKNKKTPIADGARVRFGDVDLLFLSPAALVARIEAAFR